MKGLWPWVCNRVAFPANCRTWLLFFSEARAQQIMVHFWYSLHCCTTMVSWSYQNVSQRQRIPGLTFADTHPLKYPCSLSFIEDRNETERRHRDSIIRVRRIAPDAQLRVKEARRPIITMFDFAPPSYFLHLICYC